MLGSLPRCSTTLFMMVETVEGVKLLGGATVVEAEVVVVLLTTISATLSTTSFNRWLIPTVMLVVGPTVVLTAEEMTGAVKLSSTPS